MNKLFKKLESISSLYFVSYSNSDSGWNGDGEGIVEVDIMDKEILFHEKGSWKNLDNREFNFRNTYRWNFNEEGVSLEHLRFGADKPVFLFTLIQKTENKWVSECGHKCDLDFYNAELLIESSQINLKWTVQGPSMDENITYVYK